MTSKNYDAEETFFERHTTTVFVALVAALAAAGFLTIIPKLHQMLSVLQ